MTCTELSWQTSVNARAARLINEIVLYEETDFDHNGNPASHLQMYLAAMREVGADSSLFENFIRGLGQGMPLREALGEANVPDYISTFVIDNIDCACAGRIEEVASSFLFAREDAIPEMFTLFLQKWGVAQSEIPALVYYLKRHINLDGDEHGPEAQKILQELVADDPAKVARATQAAIHAIEDRIALWDGIVGQIRAARR